MAKPQIRCAIYARFSTDKQRDASIDDQVHSCREHALRHGWSIAEVYSDRASSGASMFRTGIERLQRDAKAGRFEIVLAEAMDRLSRNLSDISKFHERMEHAGIGIHTLTEGKVDQMMIGMKGTMNAMQLRDIGIKTARGQRGRVRAGKIAGGNSYGYDVLPGVTVNGKEEFGNRAINSGQAAVIRRIFEDYARGISAGKIAEALNLEKVPGPRGGYWGGIDDPWQSRTRNRDPEQRAVYRPAGLEPTALQQGPGHEEARFDIEPRRDADGDRGSGTATAGRCSLASGEGTAGHNEHESRQSPDLGPASPTVPVLWPDAVWLLQLGVRESLEGQFRLLGGAQERAGRLHQHEGHQAERSGTPCPARARTSSDGRRGGADLL